MRVIFRDRGERAFRAIERDVAREITRSRAKAVCALGGGTVVDDETRAELQASGFVVTLRAPVEELLRRIGDDAERPLLDGAGGERPGGSSLPPTLNHTCTATVAAA